MKDLFPLQLRTVVTLLLTVVLTGVPVVGKSCDFYTPCSCVFDDGTGMMDLSPLTQTSGYPL